MYYVNNFPFKFEKKSMIKEYINLNFLKIFHNLTIKIKILNKHTYTKNHFLKYNYYLLSIQ